MATSNQQTDLRKVFYQCRLGRDDLDRLFAMACEGIQAPDMAVSTVSGSTRFWDSRLQDLVAAVQAETGDPSDNWSNLTLEAKTAGGERSVSIKIDTERTEFHVSGSDATWAYGQAARLENFLSKRGAVTQSPKYETKISIAFAIFFVALAVFTFTGSFDTETAEECIKRAKPSKSKDLVFNASMALLLTGGLAGAIIPIFKRRALRAQLRVNSEVPGGGWWFRLSTGEKVAVAGIPIAALAAIGALMSGFSDVFGK
ncbi:hypothetical protein AB0O18_13920 [Streptomyces sp. NPDC093224]|uniref:hypothetical protein n=1 Tax=Streptomyces sp. NPDC093224 TaxID=3155198 RepID=UPI00341818E1